jgi:hypothetical protein
MNISDVIQRVLLVIRVPSSICQLIATVRHFKVV